MHLRPCSACRRHVATDARACPFCAALLDPVPSPISGYGRMSRAAAFAGATLATACWSQSQPSEPTPPPIEQSQRTTDTPGSHEPQRTEPPPPYVPAAGTGAIRVIVKNSHGARLAGSPIGLQVRKRIPEYQQRATSDANGEFLFSGLAPGEYRVTAGQSAGPHAAPDERMVNLSAGAMVQIELVPYVRQPPPNWPSNQPMPYGAPPARHRVV